MSVGIDTLERVKSQLKELKDLGNNVNLDLYQHLTEVFNRIMLHHQQDGYQRFEEISHLVKQTHLKIKDPAYDYEVNAQQSEQNDPQRAQWIQKSKNLLKEIVDQLPRDERDLLTKDKTFIIPNIPEEQRMFEWAGIVFGEELTAKLTKAIKRLAVLSGASQLRFWGKVYGIQKDYWVAEGILDTQEEGKQSMNQEKRGEGINKLVYWVNDNLLEDWVQLPDLLPEHVQVARMMKHVLTGNLNAQIDSCPPFPGKERHYLRAQIGRISHATTIVPKDLWSVDEETTKDKASEEFTMPGTEELKNLEGWCHLHPIILKAGRVSHFAGEGLADEERDEILAKLNEKDPAGERFKAINDDAAVEGYKSAWISKVIGDAQPFAQAPPKEGTTTYAANVLKSLRWPGAVTVAQNGKFQSIYVGYGQKRGDVCFNPTEPPEVQKDPIDQTEQPEPTPLHAPKVVPVQQEEVKPEEDEE
ncbi:UNKNOWN [Stylonychia lemnae]|uniref:Uncharacterized protein n=1 Tax=Stylonychia lemnae TaxID=5949 RepID=A0A078A8H1_STYLE|nr:UNKNOWN [Stylonychia lemnae]|eukprot:CDW78166.1 UNKNOWN [Stylonychia lemnae]